jgi:hypothetical protein
VDANPIATARRRRRRLDRLSPDSFCFFCGYSNPIALMRRPRSLLQKDHVYGRKRDSESMIVICRNCDAEITEDRMREGVPMRRERDPKMLVAYRLLARSTFQRKDADAMRDMAMQLLGDEND